MIFIKKFNIYLIGLVVAALFICLGATTGLADQLQDARGADEAQMLINASGASWTAGKTSVFAVPAEQLCGSELHPDAKAAKTAETFESILEDAYPPDAPTTWDWRSYNGHDWTTPIRNQGGCGSCYIFGTFAASEGAMKVQAGTYGYLADPDLSEQFPLSCNAAFNCTSGYSGDALSYLRDTGSTDDGCFPYTGNHLTPCSNRCSDWADKIYKINSWDHPGGYPNWTPSVAQIKDAIMTHGPVATYMYVYSDFRDYYTGGVYTHTFGTGLGGHTVTIVGWNDSLQCWIAKNSWGTGWGENGWFRIKWGEVDIERQTEFVDAGMANLTDYPHTGWTYSMMPRSTTDTTWASSLLPSTLPGNADSTYLNFAGINNGTEGAPGSFNRFYIDDAYVYWGAWGPIGAGGQYWAGNLGPLTVRGGRHTIGVDIDYNEQIWESNETDVDNKEFRQFVWSPYGLYNNTPVTRSSPPKKDSYGYSWYNADGFSFNVEQVHPDNWWSAVGVLPSSSSADYDVRLHDIGTYTGSEGGFGINLEYSSYGGSASDFVIVNDNMAAAGTYYAGVLNDNQGTGDFRIEEDTSEKIFDGINGPYYKSTTNVLDIYECYLDAGDYGFRLEQTAGTCDLGMTLYDDETTHCQKSEYMTGGYANSTGDGGAEYFRLTIPDSGYHGLVVWKVDASDYAKSSTYKITMGQCGTPSTPSGPSPADGAINISVNTDLDWADSTYTQYYEVWLREGAGAWVKLGETETSEWALGTLNEGTDYEWFIAANNVCGSRVYVYWDFTTEDHTPPSPSPMTWVTEPYEFSTSEIRMVGTTATDPSTPITYYFQYGGSPTGGAGATTSGWISSTSYADTGLGANHQYGYRVYAKDSKGNTTAASSLSYDYTDIEIPAGILFGIVTPTSIQIKSSSTPSGLTRGSSGLYLYNTNGTSSGWQQHNNYWTSSGLSPNTEYGFRATAKNGDGKQTGWSSTHLELTLANAPVAAGFSNVTCTSIRANWKTNGNPAGTEYYCENTTAGTNSGWTTAISWNSTGLTPLTPYNFKVKARNKKGIETAWVALGSQSTPICPDVCECDLNKDGKCDMQDWLKFGEDWGRTDCNLPGVDCECDLNGDGKCDMQDWLKFGEDWGRTDCP